MGNNHLCLFLLIGISHIAAIGPGISPSTSLCSGSHGLY